MPLKFTSFCLLLVLLLATIACRKQTFDAKCDTAVDQQSEQPCFSFATVNTGNADCFTGFFYRPLNEQVKAPCFNPSNSNEFIYLGKDGLTKYNMAGNTKTVLLNDFTIVGQPDWGKAGWIVFAGIDWNIYKIRDDGTGLKQLTNTPRDLYPEFNPNGTKVLYARNMEYSGKELEENPSLWQQYKMMIIDLEGNEVDSFCRPFQDTLCNPWQESSWSKDNLFAARYSPDGTTYGLAVYTIDGGVETVLFQDNDPEKAASIQDIEWLPSGMQLVYSGYTDGIYKIDRTTRKEELIKKSCQNLRYGQFSVSPNGSKLLVAKEQYKHIEGCEMSVKYAIVMMDLNGCNEEVILE